MKILNSISIKELLDKPVPQLAQGFVFVTIENSASKKTHDMIVSPTYVDEVKKNGLGNESIFLIKKEGLELLKQRGRFFPFLDEFFNAQDGKGNKDWRAFLSQDMKQDLNNPEYEWIIVNNKYINCLMSVTTGEYIPEPMYLNSVHARLDDSQYDLDSFAEKLSHRKNIGFLTYQSRFSNEKPGLLFTPLKGNEPGIGGIISDITHHLEEGEATPLEKEQLNLVFYPTSEELKKTVQFINDFENDKNMRINMIKQEKIMNYEQFIVRKILGGDEFFKHHTQTQDSVPKRKFKS